MAFRGIHLIRSKIVIDGSIMEQVYQFNYLGCELSLVGEVDLDKKLNRFQHMYGTIRRYLKKTSMGAQVKLYKVTTRPTLLYWSETWVTTKRDDSRITAAEMRFLRGIKGYRRLDKIKNSYITEELQISGII